MDIDSIYITFMELNEINELANALSIAMLNNSLHIAVLKGKGETQRLKIESMFVDLFNHNPGITYVAKEDRRIVGVMRMKSCCGSTVKKRVKENKKEKEIDHRIKIWHQEWAANDPLEQHWHLGPIGVIPSHQDQGIGSMLMNLFCKEVDKCSATAFLETDLDKNVSFYNKFGFEVVSTSNIFGVESRYMAREASIPNNP
jgi:ribosomal protein S18 acetylase RimI-like enzyme